MRLETWLSLEREEEDEHRNRKDTKHIEGRPWLTRGHGDEFLIPHGLVGVHWEFKDHFLVGKKVERQWAWFGGVRAAHHRVRDVIHSLLKLEMHTDVICLQFVLATEYEEIVAISWNPAERKVITFNWIGVLPLTITLAYKIYIKTGSSVYCKIYYSGPLHHLARSFTVPRTNNEQRLLQSAVRYFNLK